MSKIENQKAFILHSRPYRDTSLILDIFTENYGRLHAIARSARGPKSRYKGLLQLFSPLIISWSGRGDLFYLAQAELDEPKIFLQGNTLAAGFYLNELLIKLLALHDPHPIVFQHYKNTLISLNMSLQEATLRIFEKNLLQRIGYELLLTHEAETEQAILPDQYYHYVVDQGPILSSKENQAAFIGQSLLALHHENFCDKLALFDAKRLIRLVLKSLLGQTLFHSRELFFSGGHHEE